MHHHSPIRPPTLIVRKKIEKRLEKCPKYFFLKIHFSKVFHKFSFREFLVFWIIGLGSGGKGKGEFCNIRVDTWTLEIGQREEKRRNHFEL